MRIIKSTNREAMAALLATSRADLSHASAAAAAIIADVRARGDQALLDWTRKLDRAAVGLDELGVPLSDMHRAWKRVSPAVRRALQLAKRNIENMARWQMPRAWTRAPRAGVKLGQIIRPLGSIGCYVPGGRHPLPSTLLMTAVPARVAGVDRIAVACPNPTDEVLAAACVAKVDALYRMGGAQAIAAFAYGTNTVAPVDKIVGPGNVYVTAAKQLVSFDCAIDFLAGPTEVLIVARGSENPQFIAADLLAQAEHDPQAAAWLLTPSRAFAERVSSAVDHMLNTDHSSGETWKDTARASISNRGAIIVTPDLREAMDWANRIAPEHITVPRALLPQVSNAGSVFVGEWTPQAVGDYVSGANHVLPTASLARLRGGLSVLDFMKVITVQDLAAAGLKSLAPAISALARAEGLEAHARSVEIRTAALAGLGSAKRVTRQVSRRAAQRA